MNVNTNKQCQRKRSRRTLYGRSPRYTHHICIINSATSRCRDCTVLGQQLLDKPEIESFADDSWFLPTSPPY